MWEFQHRVRRLIAGLMALRAESRIRRADAGTSMDWLPPVLDPGDWSVGMMADRSAGWYFDRN